MTVRVRTGAFIVGGVLVALLLAGVVSNFASNSPDGLDATAERGCTTDAAGNITGGTCIAQSERDNETGDSPLAGYGIRGVESSFLSNGLAGVAGVLLTFALGGAVFWLARRRGAPPKGPAGSASSGSASSGSAAGGEG